MFMARGLIAGAFFLCIFKYKRKFFYSMFVFWRELIYNCNNGMSIIENLKSCAAGRNEIIYGRYFGETAPKLGFRLMRLPN